MIRVRFRALPGLCLVAGLIISAAGCANKQSSAVVVRSAQDGVAPALVVERFLNALNANDLETMGRLFGTQDGSIIKRDGRALVEQRMFALATLLRHDHYAIEGESIVPGRMGEAVRLRVRLDIGNRSHSVPVVVVKTKDGSWLVEEIDVEKVTGSV